MTTTRIKRLSDKYRSLFLGLLFFILHFSVSAQTYNSSVCCTVSNKAYGAAQAISTDGRSWFYDATNFVMRDYNGTTEVFSYLNLAKYRSGHFPVFVHLGGILQSNGVWLGGITQVYWFKDSTGNANLVRWYTDSTGVSGGPFYAVANNLSEGNAGLIKGNLALDLVNNTSDAQKNAASVSLTNHTIDANNNTLLHIPNSALTNNSIGLTITANSASDISVTTTPAALGISLVANMPNSGPSSRGPLTSANWNFFNGKLDSIHVSNDSVYNCVNGTCTLQSVIAGGGAVNSVAGANTSLLFSPNTGNVLGEVNPAFTFNWTGQHSFLSFAPIFSTLTTNGGIFYGSGSGQLLQSGAGSSGQIFQSNGGSAPTFFSPNAGTVNGWLGYTALSNALGSTHLFVGNGSNIATDVALTQDASISNTGVWTNTGLKGAALPTLAAGNLRYTGSAWVFDNSGSATLATGRVGFGTAGLLDAAGSSSFTWDNTNKSLHSDSVTTRFINIFPDTLKKEIITIHTINGDTATVTRGSNFRHLLDQSFTNPDGLRDAVYTMGWNIDGAGNRVNTNAGGYSINMENHFLPGGGAKNFELHIPEVLYKNGTTTRLMSWTFNEDSVNGFNHLDMRFSDMNWSTPNRLRNFFHTDTTGAIQIHTTGIGDNQPIIMTNNLTGKDLIINNASTGAQFTTTNGFLFDAGSIGPFQFFHGNTGVQIQNSNDNFLNPTLTVLSSIGAQNFIMHGDGSATFGQTLNVAGVLTGSTYIGVGTGGTTEPSAIMEAKSTTKGFLLPRINTSQQNAISSPTTGLIIYNTDSSGLVDYNGAAWLRERNGGTATLVRYQHTIFTPTTGGTVNLVNGQYNIINPAGALLTLTVNLPSSPANNDVVYIKFTQNITTVTYANGTVVDGITAPTAGGLTVLTYDSGTTSWY